MLRTLTRPLTECGMQRPSPQMAEFHSWITLSKTSRGSHSRASIQDRWCLCMKVWPLCFYLYLFTSLGWAVKGFFKPLTWLLYELCCWFHRILVINYSYSFYGECCHYCDLVQGMCCRVTHITIARFVYFLSLIIKNKRVFSTNMKSW